jgi:hypothetical protein
LKPEKAVQELIKKYNFKPGKKYTLEKITTTDGRNGGTLRNYKKLPTRTFQLTRDAPLEETGLYDLEDPDDFKTFFEKNYGTLDNGVYTVRTSRGGNDGMATFFELRLENGKVVNWWKKSKGNKDQGYSSEYHGFQHYFNKREELGV